jgi:signal transduction histidine kinase
MAAGVAHEVRNPLTTVMGFLQLMSQDKEFEVHKNKYKLMIDEINRINKIITEFLDIAKDKPNKLELCNLKELIEYVFPLLETKAIKESKLVLLELTDIPLLNIDKNEIRQLLLNLVNNSLDAMNANKTVRIITFEDNGEVVLSIEDEGTGISSSLIDKIGTLLLQQKRRELV